MNRRWAEHLQSPNAVCRPEADREEAEELHGVPGWAEFPVLVIYSDSLGTHAGAKAPRNTHLRALTVSTWQLSLNATDTIHVLATTFLRSVFLWIERKSSFQPGAMPETALFVFPGFQKYH